MGSISCKSHHQLVIASKADTQTYAHIASKINFQKPGICKPVASACHNIMMSIYNNASCVCSYRLYLLLFLYQLLMQDCFFQLENLYILFRVQLTTQLHNNHSFMLESTFQTYILKAPKFKPTVTIKLHTLIRAVIYLLHQTA